MDEFASIVLPAAITAGLTVVLAVLAGVSALAASRWSRRTETQLDDVVIERAHNIARTVLSYYIEQLREAAEDGKITSVEHSEAFSDALQLAADRSMGLLSDTELRTIVMEEALNLLSGEYEQFFPEAEYEEAEEA